MTLPPAIATYFAAQDVATLASAFAPEAKVQDEGQTHQGLDQIAAWWAAARSKYKHSATPLDLTEAEGKTVVRASVSGDFPGSPLVLRFTFGQEGGLIRALRITA
jgi:hypothetical protein